MGRLEAYISLQKHFEHFFWIQMKTRSHTKSVFRGWCKPPNGPWSLQEGCLHHHDATFPNGLHSYTQN